MRRYGLTLDDVRQLVRGNSLDLSAGDLKTPTQDIVVRTTGQRYTAEEFAAIPLLTTETGAIITLGEVARVVDGFEDADLFGRFNGKPGVLVSVLKAEREDALEIAEAVHRYVESRWRTMPPGLLLSVWSDTSTLITGRLQLLTNNGLMGLLLVAICLWVFMNARLAFWVAAGLPVAFMGAFWLIDYYGGTMNMITMFACIMAIGILVDDAIVVGREHLQPLAPRQIARAKRRSMARAKWACQCWLLSHDTDDGGVHSVIYHGRHHGQVRRRHSRSDGGGGCSLR